MRKAVLGGRIILTSVESFLSIAFKRKADLRASGISLAYGDIGTLNDSVQGGMDHNHFKSVEVDAC